MREIPDRRRAAWKRAPGDPCSKAHPEGSIDPIECPCLCHNRLATEAFFGGRSKDDCPPETALIDCRFQTNPGREVRDDAGRSKSGRRRAAYSGGAYVWVSLKE